MNARRLLIPLLLSFSILFAACGGSSGTAPAPESNSGSDQEQTSGEQADSGEASGEQADSGEASGEQADSGEASGEQVEMLMAWWGSQSRHDRTIEVIKLFEEQNPNVKITFEFSAFNDYFTKLTTQAAGGNLPCLMQQDYQKIAEWVSRDQLMALDTYIEDGTIDTANVDDAYLDGGRLDGKLYAINLGTNSQAMLIDKESFEKAGLELPAQDWTWKEFGESINKIHEELGTFGMATGLADNQVFKLWLKQHGKSLYNKEGTALGYEDDQLFVDFFKMLKGFSASGAMPTREFEIGQQNVGLEDSIFVKQEAAVGYQWSNQIVAVTSAAGGREIAGHLFPRPEDGHHGHYLKPSMFFSITKGCEQADIAAKFIDFFTNSIEANKILAAERGIPISSKVREALEVDLGPAQKEAFSLVSTVGEDPSTLDPADPPGSIEVVQDVYTPLMDQILYDRISPEEAATQFREQANAILSQNQ